MSGPLELFRKAESFGLRLEADGGDLVVKPANKCPPDFAALLRANKAALLAWLRSPPCPGSGAAPPADLPLKSSMPRPTPQNRERVLSYLRRQTGDRPGPLAAWLVDRESRYFDGPGRKWDCALLAYAAARDVACWQLNRSEREVWELLASFDMATRWPQAP